MHPKSLSVRLFASNNAKLSKLFPRPRSIVYTLMRDPVTLPTSGTVVDSSTIKSHLLSDTKDPFNRMPLSFEEVIPSKFPTLTSHYGTLTDLHARCRSKA